MLMPRRPYASSPMKVEDGKEDLKRLLAIYFEQNTTTERFEDYDGQRFLEVTG